MTGFRRWAAAAWVAVAAVSGLVRMGGLTLRRVESIPLCAFRFWTGLPCPGCGMGHALIAAFGGRWRESFHDHPLGIPLLVLWTFWLLHPLVIKAGWPERSWAFSKRRQACLELGALGLILTVYAARLIQR